MVVAERSNRLRIDPVEDDEEAVDYAAGTDYDSVDDRGTEPDRCCSAAEEERFVDEDVAEFDLLDEDSEYEKED